MKILTKVLLIIIAFCFLGTLFYSYFIYSLTPERDKVYEFTIEKDENLDNISKKLKDIELIKDPLMFKLYMKFKNADKKIKAGEYRIENIKDINSLISILEKGQEKLIKYTIPEGFDIEKIAERLSDLNLVNKDEFLDLALKRGNEFDFKFSSEIKNGNLEGFLFPDTYLISEPDAKKVILQMLSGFENIFDEKMIVRAKELNMSVKDVVTLASIVEREAQLDEERPIIASVFLNRLKAGWNLEACSTVEYVVKKAAPVLTLTDLQIDSPYNTYKYAGLPPTPICSPGKSSMVAVLYPADTEYFYFVSKGDGSHAFGKTFSEHQRNIEKYLK